MLQEFMSKENQDRLRAQLLQFIKRNPHITYIYKHIGISRHTFYSFLKERPCRRIVLAKIENFLNEKSNEQN